MTNSIVVSGATGRVGASLCACILASNSHRLAGALASDASSGAIKIGDKEFFVNEPPETPIDAVIDFSTDVGCRRAIDTARRHHAALIVGTTSLSDDTRRRLDDAAREIPVLVAANTSLGAGLVAALAAEASRALGPSWDVSIVETHRAGKRDAPSGTALWIAGMIRAAGGAIDPAQIHAVRVGDTIGEHSIRFTGFGEVIEITHRATNRDVFAAGALRAADWLRRKPAGHYRITDVLDLAGAVDSDAP